MVIQLKLPKERFEPGSSGIGSDHAVNCATTTAQTFIFLFAHFCAAIFLWISWRDQVSFWLHD